MTIRVCVTGGGGFIGSHLVGYLKDQGYWVRAIDLKHPDWGWPGESPDEMIVADLRNEADAIKLFRGMDHVYALAANMGGIGFILLHHCQIVHDNTQINLNTAEAALFNGVKRLFFASSACVYPEDLQMHNAQIRLRESDAWTGRPDSAYGSEKLYAEEIFRWLRKEHGLSVRIGRYHNIFGPFGTYCTDRTKLPAAACRKVYQAKKQGSREIPVWGTGEAVRSFCYIADAVRLTHALMLSKCTQPLNIGSDQGVTVNYVFDLVSEIAGWPITKVYEPDAPVGVMYRNADLSELLHQLQTKDNRNIGPAWSLRDGLQATYNWIATEPGDPPRTRTQTQTQAPIYRPSTLTAKPGGLCI